LSVALRSLSLGGCGDVSKAAGWALVEGSLVHTTANAALAKKVRFKSLHPSLLLWIVL
jgi:hypothetical protein